MTLRDSLIQTRKKICLTWILWTGSYSYCVYKKVIPYCRFFALYVIFGNIISIEQMIFSSLLDASPTRKLVTDS